MRQFSLPLIDVDENAQSPCFPISFAVLLAAAGSPCRRYRRGQPCRASGRELKVARAALRAFRHVLPGLLLALLFCQTLVPALPGPAERPSPLFPCSVVETTVGPFTPAESTADGFPLHWLDGSPPGRRLTGRLAAAGAWRLQPLEDSGPGRFNTAVPALPRPPPRA